MSVLLVEVFPIEATRWIAVIDAPAGAFSTEVSSPELVAGEVAEEQSDRLTVERACGRPLTPRERVIPA